jgi:CubicO group peptidase (beta-lactamase class C family)
MVAQEVEAKEVDLDQRALDRIGNHFDEYVHDGRLSGYSVLVARRDRVAYLASGGQADSETGQSFGLDQLVRIYSMTKPITSVAIMMLYEEGRVALTDPVSKYIPSFRDTKVFAKGSSTKPVLVPTLREVTIWNLLTHTSGLTYGFHYAHVVDAIYRANGYDFGTPSGLGLEEVCDQFASMPLLFQPGEEWNYSVATDVLGRIVEVASGLTLDEFLKTRIFEPLGMNETGFWVNPSEADRVATLYAFDPKARTKSSLATMAPAHTSPPAFLSGGGGLYSSLTDYYRFARMLLNEGAHEGNRLLSSRTIEYMRRNHLPGGADLETFGRPLNAEASSEGVGFGLGFSVVIDPIRTKSVGSAGTFGWGGAASTVFSIDPQEELVVIFLTQLLPSSTYPIRPELQQLVYSSLR